jgi:nucleoside recognition membrane protein YjiH
MTTIGYGDFFPKTTPGRILTFVLAVWGVVIVSLMVVALSTFVDPTNRQKKSFHMIKQLNLADTVREKSGNLVVSLYKSFKVYK